MTGALGGLTAADDETEFFAEDTDANGDTASLAVDVTQPPVDPTARIRAVYDAAAKRLSAQRAGMSGRQMLGAALVGFGQPNEHGVRGGIANASQMMLKLAMQQNQDRAARQAKLEDLELARDIAVAKAGNAYEIAKARNDAAVEAARIRAAAPKAPPALAPAAFDDAGRPLNPFTGQPLAPGTAIDRRGNLVALADLEARYGVQPPSGPARAPTERPAAVPAGSTGDEHIETIGGVQFFVRPDGTRRKIGEAPAKLRPATLEEAKRYGATAGQINEKTGEFIPSKEAPTAAEAKKLDAATLDSIDKADRVIADVDRALKNAGPLTTGIVGAVTKNIPSTPAFNLRELLKPVQANLGFDELARMRAASPTGGALGQVAVKELEFLQGAVASLEQAQSQEQFEDALGRVRTHYQRWRAVLEKSRRASETANAPASSGGAPTLAQFLTAAKKANPNKTDAELKAYYEQKYGGR